jgi:hypothetical protein
MNFLITFHCASVRSIHPIYTPTFCVQVLFMRWLLDTNHEEYQAENEPR